ncbi:MAG TPA: glycoside hydrolase family 15 protein [Pseudonocardiaceae bacterium]|nr:glycoside hydrolase family 15 protein [Pseudonocardiaceae bacterium]
MGKVYQPVNGTVTDPTNRVAASVGVLLAGQHPGGGYIACPTYPTYRYAWLRDGAFCAYAMGLHGQHSSAADFHGFVARALLRCQELFEAATTAGTDGGPVPPCPRRATR